MSQMKGEGQEKYDLRVYSFNRMQFSYENLQTLRKSKNQGALARARSLDHFDFRQLTPEETKLLLSLPKKPTDTALQLAVMKQEVLIKKKLFDPFKFFGPPQTLNLQKSSSGRQLPRFEAAFTCDQGLTERKMERTVEFNRKNSRIQESSSMRKNKPSVVSNQKSRRTIGRSPKSYVKENKQNFQKLNLNNMQKVRVKLKLGKH